MCVWTVRNLRFHRCKLVSSVLSSRTLSIRFQQNVSLCWFNARKSSSQNRESFNLQTDTLLLLNSNNQYFTQNFGPRTLLHTKLPHTFMPNVHYTHCSPIHARISRMVSLLQLFQTKFCRLCIFNFLPHATGLCQTHSMFPNLYSWQHN